MMYSINVQNLRMKYIVTNVGGFKICTIHYFEYIYNSLNFAQSKIRVLNFFFCIVLEYMYIIVYL
jgi:hypothetical protein